MQDRVMNNKTLIFLVFWVSTLLFVYFSDRDTIEAMMMILTSVWAVVGDKILKKIGLAD